MNIAFKPEPLVAILADIGVSISDLKKNPAAVIAAAREKQVAILNRNRPVAYVIAPHVWAYLCDLVEDDTLARLAREALTDPNNGEIGVSFDDL